MQSMFAHICVLQIRSPYRLFPGACFMKPCAILKLDFLTSAYNKCIALVRKSSFSKAQGLHGAIQRAGGGGM